MYLKYIFCFIAKLSRVSRVRCVDCSFGDYLKDYFGTYGTDTEASDPFLFSATNKKRHFRYLALIIDPVVSSATIQNDVSVLGSDTSNPSFPSVNIRKDISVFGTYSDTSDSIITSLTTPKEYFINNH